MKLKLSILFSVLFLLFTSCQKEAPDKVNFYKSQERDSLIIGKWLQEESEDENIVRWRLYTQSGEYHKAIYRKNKKKDSDPRFYHDGYFYTKEGNIYYYHQAQPAGKAAYETSQPYVIDKEGKLVQGGVFKKISD